MVLLAVYALPFIWFITHADRFAREPVKLALLGFLWGGLAATWVLAVPGNDAVLSIYSKLIAKYEQMIEQMRTANKLYIWSKNGIIK